MEQRNPSHSAPSNASRSFHYTVHAAGSFDTSKKTTWDTYYVTNVTYTHHIHITYTSYTHHVHIIYIHITSNEILAEVNVSSSENIKARVWTVFALFEIAAPAFARRHIHKALSPFELCAAFVILNFGPCDTPTVLFFHQLSSGSYQLQGANLCSLC